MRDLTGKVALITGASAGIGLSAARKLVACGARVALVARTASKLEAAVRELGEAHAVAFPRDVTDRAAMRALPGEVAARLGSLDILINNAGQNHRGNIAERTADELVSILETNLVAPVFLTRVALDHMRPGGIVVNVASLAGKIPFQDEATYCASKAGLRAFSVGIGYDLASRDIRVTSVNPGPVDTEFFGDIHSVPDLVFSQPMSSADEVADVILRCIRAEETVPEADIPASSGKLATLGYLIPQATRVLRPMLEKKGAAAKARYIAKKGLR